MKAGRALSVFLPDRVSKNINLISMILISLYLLQICFAGATPGYSSIRNIRIDNITIDLRETLGRWIIYALT